MATFGAAVKAVVHVPLTQGQFDALVSFSYNCGLGNLKSSTLLKMVNASDFADAAGQFQRWDRCNGQPLPGLLRRREAEAQLFAGAAPVPAGTVDPAVRVVDAPAD
jgi:lysozyme